MNIPEYYKCIVYKNLLELKPSLIIFIKHNDIQYISDDLIKKSLLQHLNYLSSDLLQLEEYHVEYLAKDYVIDKLCQILQMWPKLARKLKNFLREFIIDSCDFVKRLPWHSKHDYFSICSPNFFSISTLHKLDRINMKYNTYAHFFGHIKLYLIHYDKCIKATTIIYTWDKISDFLRYEDDVKLVSTIDVLLFNPEKFVTIRSDLSCIVQKYKSLAFSIAKNHDEI